MTHQSALCTHTAPQRTPLPLSGSSAAVQSQNRSAQKSAALHSNTGVSSLLAIGRQGACATAEGNKPKLCTFVKSCIHSMLARNALLHSQHACNAMLCDRQPANPRQDQQSGLQRSTDKQSSKAAPDTCLLTPAYFRLTKNVSERFFQINYGSRYLRSQIP